MRIQLTNEKMSKGCIGKRRAIKSLLEASEPNFTCPSLEYFHYADENNDTKIYKTQDQCNKENKAAEDFYSDNKSIERIYGGCTNYFKKIDTVAFDKVGYFLSLCQSSIM